MKLQIRDLSPPFMGLIIGMPIFVLMNMLNLYFQPQEVIHQIEQNNLNGNTVFLIGKLISLFISVFVAAGIAYLIRPVKSPWTFRIMAGFTIMLSLVDSAVQSYPYWYWILAIICCLLSISLSKIFVYKF